MGRSGVRQTPLSNRRLSSRARLALPFAPLLTLAPRFSSGFLAGAQDASWIAPPPPDVSAKAIYSIDITRGTELFVKNPDTRLAMGSLAKIATALTVRNINPDLEQTITIEEGDLVPDPTMFSNMGLQAGMVLSIHELLTGLMIPSANDAAAALSRVLGANLPGGDVDPRQAFMDSMNQLVYQLGATRSHFATPDGLEPTGDMSSVEHVTTARDLATLASHLLADSVMADIVKQFQVTVTPHNEDAEGLLLYSTNKELPGGELEKPNVVGVKTGSTEIAGGCLVIASTQGENTVLSVVLGSDLEYGDSNDEGYRVDARWDDFESIYDRFERDYTWRAIDDDSFPGLSEELSAWGVSLQASGSVVTPNADGDPRYRLELGPAGQPEAEVGRVLFFAGSTVVATLPVYQNATS